RWLPLRPFELEVGQHPQLLEAREVSGIDELQMRHLVAVVPVAVRLTRGLEGIEACSHRMVSDGMDMHRETGGVELGNKPFEMLRIKIEVAQMIGGLAASVEIGRKERRRLRRVFHYPVGEDLDDTGVEEIWVYVAGVACSDEFRNGFIAVVTRIALVDRHAYAHVELAAIV